MYNKYAVVSLGPCDISSSCHISRSIENKAHVIVVKVVGFFKDVNPKIIGVKFSIIVLGRGGGD